jgi:CRISPR-associated protein Csd1
MILQALNEQYERLKNNPDEDIPLRGFSREKVQFAFVLDRNGKLLQIDDLRKEKNASPTIIVPEPVKKSVNIAANFLSGNTGYVLGRSNEEKEKTAKDQRRGGKTFNEFKRLHTEIGKNTDDIGIHAVLRFLDSWNPLELEKSLC